MMKPWNKRLFLFINGRLYRRLRINKADDLYIAQDTQTQKIQTFSYKVVRDTSEKAYNVREVGEFLGRKPDTIRRAISRGHVDPQKQSYNVNPNTEGKVNALGVVSKNTGRCEYYFSREDLFEIRDHFAHGSAYARTGKRAVPTREELRAMLEQSVVLYVKTNDGTFVPTWQAVEL